MNAKDVLQQALKSTHFILNTYLTDLSDADLLVRPVPEAHHIAWQLGHLIAAEKMLLSEVPGAVAVELPAGFAEKHAKDRGKENSPKEFATKAEYLGLFARAREATQQTVAKLTEADLAKPNTGRLAKFAPTISDLLVLISNHTLMHAGQWVVVRRKLGKPVLI